MTAYAKDVLQSGQGAALNDYFFRYRFTISDPYILSAFRLQLNFLADNQVQNVYVNGVGQAPQTNLPQASGSYTYSGFNIANQASTVLSNNWQLGMNEIVVHTKSGPRYAGFLGQNVAFCAGLDFGDAPSTYGVTKAQLGPGHIIKTDFNGNVLLRMGNLVDAETDGVASASASNDDDTNQDDEDGVTFPTICAGNSTITASVAVHNINITGAKLYGWIDFNQNGIFEATEAAPVVAADQTGNYLLTWTGITGLTAGTRIARIRLTSDPNITVNTPTNPAFDGEVEDYQIPINATSLTAVSSLTLCEGETATITYSTTPATQVRWVRQPGNISGFGDVIDVPPAVSPSSPTTYTYTAQTSGTVCASNEVTTVVTVNPRPVITPSLCSQTICSGQTGAITFDVTIPGSTIHWERTPATPAPASGTGNISQTLTNTGPTSVTYTYKIWADSPAPASCPSSTTITCEIVVTPGLTVTALASSATVCVGSPLSLSATATPTGSYTYTWSGPNGYIGSGINPTVSATAAITQSGTYTVVVTDASGCSGTAVVEAVVQNCCFDLAANSNSPVCATNTLQLNAFMQGGSGNFTYAWTGPNNFNSNQPNPTIPNATTAASGLYMLVVTDVTSACSQTATTAVTIATQPVLAVTGSPSLTICSGQSTTLSVGGSNGATVIWSSSNGSTGTGTSINTGVLTNNGTGPLTIVYYLSASAGGGDCTDQDTVLVTVNPVPQLQIIPTSSVVCNLEQVTVRAIAPTSSTAINWTRTPNTPGTATGTGTGSVLIQEVLPPASYTYQFTATGANGCTSQPISVPVTVQQ
ncbi:hypothetical protein GCM10027347_60050 [Larkinella harenae]